MDDKNEKRNLNTNGEVIKRLTSGRLILLKLDDTSFWTFLVILFVWYREKKRGKGIADE